MTTEADTYLNAVRPRRGWVAGLKGLATTDANPGARPVEMVGATALILGGATVVSLGLEYVWHPLFYVPWAITLAPLMQRIAFRPYTTSARNDAIALSQAITIVQQDLGREPGSRAMLSDPEAERSVRTMLSRGGSEARECVMRLAALSTQIEVSDPQEIRTIATAIVSRFAPSMPDLLPAAADDRRATLSRIAGSDVDTIGVRLVYDQTGAHLRAIAEKALADEPDLTDATGAPLAPLIRQHLPDLLAAYAAAMRHADAASAAEAERGLTDGLERIRRSVEEALDASRREASENLLIKVRFLRMRRGDA